MPAFSINYPRFLMKELRSVNLRLKH